MQDIKERSQLLENSSKLYNTDHKIPAYKSNELSFYEKQLELPKDTGKNAEAIEQYHTCSQATKRAVLSCSI